MVDQIRGKKKVKTGSMLFFFGLMLFINLSLSGIASSNSALGQTIEGAVEKTPNEWETLTNLSQPDAGYAHTFNDHIYFIGKVGVQVYDPVTNLWEIVTNTGLPDDHMSGGSVLLGDCIYFLYGWNNALYYNISANSFVTFERSSIPRTDVAVAELNGLIYVSGGWVVGNPTSLTLVEVYNPETNVWSEVASMNVGRKRHEMVALDGYLYTIGGEIEESFTETTKSVERYDHTTNSWQTVSVPTYSYSNFGVTATDNHNFVAIHFTTEVYNASSEKWLRGPDLYPTFRDILHPALTYYNGCIYAIGGQQFIEGNDYHNSFHRWNIETHKFVAFSNTPTFLEFLSIWPRVFPSIQIIVQAMVVIVLGMSFVSTLFGKAMKPERLREMLFEKTYPIKIAGFRGNLISNVVYVLSTTLIAIVLMPVISFFPIMLYNANFRIIDLFLLGYVPGFLVTYVLVLPVVNRYDYPKVFFFEGGIGLQSFSSDLLIPVTRLRRIYIDQQRKWVALRVKFRIFPEFWGTQYFAFVSTNDLDTFIDAFRFQINLPVEHRSLSSLFHKFLIVPHKNVVILPPSELEYCLHSKTLKVLEPPSKPGNMKEFLFPKSDSSEI